MITHHEIALTLESKNWIFAKTMPQNPHWYTLKKQWSNNDDFDGVVKFIRANGYKEKFKNSWYTLLNLNGYKYWTMGAPIDQTNGYTQPIVTIFDKENDCFVIVDGFHRYFVMKNNQDIYDMNHGLLPIVVINSHINDRMASTVRHNRARGKHSVTGMSSMVFSMLENGWEDSQICNELGMEAEELLKLKHITGFSKLFQNVEYQKSWETKRQIELRRDYKGD
jgi:hypothetical protein